MAFHEPTPEQRQQAFQKISEPLVEWMAQNLHPHHTAVVTATGAELLEGQTAYQTEKYLRD